MDNNRQFVSVVIATLNEEEGIGPTLQEMQNVLQDTKFVVVDGNSVDKTIEIAKNMGADVLLQEGKGKGDAMYQGFRLYGSKKPLMLSSLTRTTLTPPSTFPK